MGIRRRSFPKFFSSSISQLTNSTSSAISVPLTSLGHSTIIFPCRLNKYLGVNKPFTDRAVNCNFSMGAQTALSNNEIFDIGPAIVSAYNLLHSPCNVSEGNRTFKCFNFLLLYRFTVTNLHFHTVIITVVVESLGC